MVLLSILDITSQWYGFDEEKVNFTINMILKQFQPGWINYPFEFRKFRIEILCVVTRLKENSK